MRERRNREHEIMDAAVEVFWRKGYSAASMQEVADAVGVLKGSLYHYISSKEELLFRIFDGSHDDALQIMEEVAAMDSEPMERLREYLVRFVTYYVTNIKRVGLYYREWRFIEGERAKELRRQRRDYDNFLIHLLEEGRAQGSVAASVDPTVGSYFIMAAINGISDWYRPGGKLSASDIAERYADMALAAIGASAPSGVSRRGRRRS